MKTTLNIPEELVSAAKRSAIDRSTTLTALIIAGLKDQIAGPQRPGSLPVSVAGGGVRPGVDWMNLTPPDPAGEWYR